MLTIEEALKAHLTANAGLVALIASRVYPVQLPQNPTLPAMVYNRISGERVQHMEGSSGLASPRFQFDSFGRTYAEAKGVSEALRLAVEGFSGTMGGVNGPDVNSCLLQSDQDGYEDDLHVYWVSVDYIIWHTEPKP